MEKYSNNKMTRSAYLRVGFIITFSALLLFRVYMFRPINGFPMKLSYGLYLVMLFISMGVCGWMTLYYHRTVEALLIFAVVPSYLYWIISVTSYGSVWMKIIVAVVLIAAGSIYLLNVMRKAVSKEDMYDLFTYFGMCIAVVVMVISLVLNMESIAEKSREKDQIWKKEYTIENNMSEMAQFDEFSGLTIEERKKLVELAVKIQQNYLGFPFEVRICYDHLDSGVVGNYRDSTKEITIDIDHLKQDSGYDVYETVTHECYHCYQHCLLQAYLSVPKSLRNLRPFVNCDDYLIEGFIHSQKEYEDRYIELITEKAAWYYGIRSRQDLEEKVAEYDEEQINGA